MYYKITEEEHKLLMAVLGKIPAEHSFNAISSLLKAEKIEETKITSPADQMDAEILEQCLASHKKDK